MLNVENREKSGEMLSVDITWLFTFTISQKLWISAQDLLSPNSSIDSLSDL